MNVQMYLWFVVLWNMKVHGTDEAKKQAHNNLCHVLHEYNTQSHEYQCAKYILEREQDKARVKKIREVNHA